MKLLFKSFLLSCLIAVSANAEFVNYWKLSSISNSTTPESVVGADGTTMINDAVAAGGVGPVIVNDSPFNNCDSMLFDGTNSWVSTTAQGVLGSEPRTVSAWIKLTVEQNRHTLFQYGKSSAGNYFRFLIENKRLRFEVASGNALAMEVDSITMDQWHHVAIVIDDFNGNGNVRTPEVKFYYDGIYQPVAQSLNQLVNTVSEDETHTVCLGGARPAAGIIPPREPLGGMLCDVRIYDNVLTDDDLFSLANPYLAGTPQPAPGAIDIEAPVTLSWEPGVDPNGYTHPELVGYNVFAGIDPEALTKVNDTLLPTSESEVTINQLLTDKTYYWMVEGVINGNNGSPIPAGDPNNLHSNMWDFATVVTAPEITTQPYRVYTDLGGTVEFTVAAESISAMSYQWYYTPDDLTNTPEDDLAVASTQTLNIDNVEASDIGYYYCVISNASSRTAVSEIAELALKRLVAKYSFENDLTDSVSEAINDGTAVGMPGFVPGVSGMALSVDGDDAVIIPNQTQESFTLSFWINTTQSAPTGADWWAGNGILDCEWPNSWLTDYGTSMTGGKFNFGIGIEEVTIKSNTLINDGVWHYCVATRDNTTGDIALYVDGLLESSATTATGVLDQCTEMRIGSLQTAIKYITADIDEVELYNYPLAPLTIAQNYTQATGRTVCFDKPMYDLSNDCKVDIEDFALLAQQWLDCGIVPDCIN